MVPASQPAMAPMIKNRIKFIACPRLLLSQHRRADALSKAYNFLMASNGIESCLAKFCSTPVAEVCRCIYCRLLRWSSDDKSLSSLLRLPVRHIADLRLNNFVVLTVQYPAPAYYCD